MATTITVTLTDEQAAKGLEYARKVKPDATNAELRAELERAAYYGPGIREVIGQWEMDATRQVENENRKVAAEEFQATFPPEPDPEVPEPPATTRKSKAKK